MKHLLARLTKRHRIERQAKRYYAQLVSRSRAAWLYEDGGIPDTLDGRFEALVLHLFIEERRCQPLDADNAEWLRLLQESFFADMDRSLREGGVGDTGIGKRVKRMASGFYGRLAAYHQAWGDEAAFKEALRRNVYATRSAPPTNAEQQALIDYVSESLVFETHKAVAAEPV